MSRFKAQRVANSAKRRKAKKAAKRQPRKAWTCRDGQWVFEEVKRG